MNEVTKLYENAESDRDCNLYKHFTECPMKHTQCEDCENFVYPPFTAEKQLELIKWLCKKQYVYIIMSADKEYYLCTDNSFISGYNKQFDKALAMFINAYWQDLTEEERKQIKEILE